MINRQQRQANAALRHAATITTPIKGGKSQIAAQMVVDAVKSGQSVLVLGRRRSFRVEPEPPTVPLDSLG